MNWSLIGFFFCLIGYGLMAGSYFYFINKNIWYTVLCNVSFLMFIIGMLCFGYVTLT